MDVKYYQFEALQAVLDTPREGRLGFGSDSKVVTYDWVGGSSSQLITAVSGVVTNTITAMKVRGWVGYNSDAARFDFGSASVTLTGNLQTISTISAGQIWIGGVRKDSNWDTGYSSRITSASAPLAVGNNSISLSVDATLTITGGTLSAVAPAHSSTTGLQGGTTGQHYHLTQVLAETLSANTINWTAGYNHAATNGSSHSFINQAVTTLSTPTFAGVISNGRVLVSDAASVVQIGTDDTAGAFRIAVDAANTRTIFQIRSGGNWVPCATLSIA